MFTNCAARRQGHTAAVPPAEMQRSSRRRLGRSNQSGPADMLTVSTQNMQRLSNLQSSSESVQPCFRFSSNFLVHARRVTLVIWSDIIWIFMWIFRMTRVDLMNIFENISKWKRIFYVEEQFKWIFQKLIMNILLEYSEMEWISKWISNTSRNEDWIFKRIIKIWMNIQLNTYLNNQRHFKYREYLLEYSFEYSLPF